MNFNFNKKIYKQLCQQFINLLFALTTLFKDDNAVKISGNILNDKTNALESTLVSKIFNRKS